MNWKVFPLTVVSALAGLTLFEAAMHLLPMGRDLLQITPVADERLRHRLEPFDAGTDEWGFRNTRRPDSAEIVAIGDSWTWGHNTTASASWPTQLGHILGKSTYNLSLGGYGPLQYLYLMRRYAISLRPKTIVVGLYLGNDVEDAYLLGTGLKYWSEFRGALSPTSLPLGVPDHPSILGKFGKLLSRNVITYDLIRAAYRRTLETPNSWLWKKANRDDVFIFESERDYLSTAFETEKQLKNYDWEKPEFQAGLRILLEALGKMNEEAALAGIAIVVAVFPTKESVYRDALLERPDLAGHPKIESVISTEDHLEAALIRFFEDRHIAYVLTRESLQNALKRERLFPNHWDSHPNDRGYQTIAQTVSGRLMPLVAQVR